MILSFDSAATADPFEVPPVDVPMYNPRFRPDLLCSVLLAGRFVGTHPISLFARSAGAGLHNPTVLPLSAGDLPCIAKEFPCEPYLVARRQARYQC